MRLPQLISRTAALMIAIAALHLSSPSEGEAPSQPPQGRLASTAPVQSHTSSDRPVNANPDPKNCYLPASGYLLIESQHPTEAEAHQRAQQLQKLGLGRCTIIWLPCAGQAAERYGLQIGPAFAGRRAAEQHRPYCSEQLAREHAGGGALEVVGL